MIKTHSRVTRTATEVADAIVKVCTGIAQDEIFGKLWKTEVRLYRYCVKGKTEKFEVGTPVTEAKIKLNRVPKGFLDKVLNFFYGDFGVTIVIPAVISYVKIHAVEINLVFGDRRVSKRRDPAVRTIYRRDIDRILLILKEKVPELNTHALE